MKFFKYLTLLLLTIISTNIYAVCTYTQSSTGKVFNSLSTLCDAIQKETGRYPPEYKCVRDYSGKRLEITTNTGSSLGTYGSTNCTAQQAQEEEEANAAKCLPAGSPRFTTFTSNTKIPTKICEPQSDGTFCVWEAGDKPFLTNHGNNKSAITVYSKSATPVSSCTPLFDNACDTSDPYGGCYTPPNDGCTRASNGSISCPVDAVPDVKDGCEGGATYCKRPPSGCGSNYVSGKFNGEAVCVKKGGNNNPTEGEGSDSNGGSSNNSSDPNDSTNPTNPTDPTNPNNGNGGTSSSTSSSTSTSTSSDGNGGSTTVNVTNNNTVNVDVDMSPVTTAINNASNKITDFLNDINNSVTDVSNKLTNTNQALNSINNNTSETNEKLTDLKTAIEGLKNGQGSSNSGATDTTEIEKNQKEGNGILQDIKDWLTDDVPDGEGVDTPYKAIQEADINSNLYQITGQCPAPKTFYAPVVGATFTYDLSMLCNVLSVMGLMVSIAACLHGVAILAENT